MIDAVSQALSVAGVIEDHNLRAFEIDRTVGDGYSLEIYSGFVPPLGVGVGVCCPPPGCCSSPARPPAIRALAYQAVALPAAWSPLFRTGRATGSVVGADDDFSPRGPEPSKIPRGSSAGRMPGGYDKRDSL
jgi:hypothetical protein